MKMWCRLIAISLIAGCCLGDPLAIAQMYGPCSFIDTINITSGHLDQNGNFHYQGNIFKKGMFDVYNYVVENLTEVVKVPPHTRGCICGLKPCIRLCCIAEESNNEACVRTDTLRVPTRDEEIEIDRFGDDYGLLVGRPCGKMYKLEPQDYADDRWYFEVSQKQHLKLIDVYT